MFKKLFSNLVDLNKRELDRLSKAVDEINSFTQKAKKLKKTDFARKTQEFKKRLEKGETIESIMPEAFAVVREASYRAIGLHPYDVQVMAAVALFEGRVAEQKTGEGKTLSAVLPLYVRALTGKGVHLVTVNDYLARRDAGWNAPTFELLGMRVGVIVQEMKSYVYDKSFSDTSHGDQRLEHLRPVERKEAYLTDITYGTNNEFGFDYLRDNMVRSLDEMAQRGHNFAIVDEVDSVLIDEARTPLIISMPDTDPTDKYIKFAQIVEKLNPDTDFTIDEKSKSASLTEHGITRLEKILGVNNLYEKDFEVVHHVENALRAKTLYLQDRDYVVKDNQVIIVDEFTGRLMFGRRWSDGLHQAVEAKEGVSIQQESKTLATISFQNYFRMYEVLSGMTGTAATESEEFKKIYKLDTVVVPTNDPMRREDRPDSIYKTLRAKYGAIVSAIEKMHKKGQPVLVGTTSIEKNEVIAQFLKKKRIPHNVLNAKNHEREAVILAEAGKPGGVTVATNMAGRGVDIVLGGAKPDGATKKELEKWESEHKKVVKAGGLHVIGTERHESRRIDNQLRGRSGRQGDPGSSRFYLSLEDDLMRIFGGDRIKNLMDTLNIPEDQPIENRLVSKAIEQAQVRVEGFNFDMRKSLVDFDDVTNQQRDIIYKLRKRILESVDVKSEVLEKLIHQAEGVAVSSFSSESSEIDPERVVVGLMEIVPFDDRSREKIKKEIEKKKDQGEVVRLLTKIIDDTYKQRESQVGEKVMREIERFAYLGSIDKEWIDHIDYMDSLREGVRLRAYGQRDPVVEFKNEAYDAFSGLIDRIDAELARRIFRVGVSRAQAPEVDLSQARANIDAKDAMGLSGGNSDQTAKAGVPIVRTTKKIGRNDPCWCGKKDENNKPVKWKKCHYPQLPR